MNHFTVTTSSCLLAMPSPQVSNGVRSQRYHSQQPGERKVSDCLVRVVFTSDLGELEFDSGADTEARCSIQLVGSCYGGGR